jgi:hypothetical protein
MALHTAFFGRSKHNHTSRTIVGVSILLIIAAMHWFRVGSYLNGNLYICYYSFASDVMLPFGAYFFLCLNEPKIKFLQKWYVKALVVFGLMTFSEVMQAFNIYFLGVTFDPIDILMFAIGVGSAALIDVQVFARLIPNWATK